MINHQPPAPIHHHESLIFPKRFLWGAATSAHQVEGNNIHSDWWEWEQRVKLPNMRSGQAVNQYELYEQDFTLAKSLGHNAQRLSIEWSRIEPLEGKFDLHQIDHYQKVLRSLKERGMKVMLTLHHFTNPLWLAKVGGWENSKSAVYFERFVNFVAPKLEDWVDFWITINEPDIYVYHMYIDRQWPNSKKSLIGQLKTRFNLASAHRKAYKLLHQISPHKMVGIAQNFQSFEPYHRHSISEQLTVTLADLLSNHTFYFLTQNCHDFYGVNYYFHHRFKHGFNGWLPRVMDVKDQSREVSDLGWEIYPEGIFDVLTDLSDHLPIYITECGIASTNDDRRTRFLIQYLQEIYRAIQAGVDVKGFFYWSLTDNFEWHRGFDPRFGLIEVDYRTQKRTPRPSAYVYREIIEHNGIPHELLKLLGHGINVEKELKKLD